VHMLHEGQKVKLAATPSGTAGAQP